MTQVDGPSYSKDVLGQLEYRGVLFYCSFVNIVRASDELLIVQTVLHMTEALLCVTMTPVTTDAEKLHLLNNLIPSQASGMTFIISRQHGPTGSAAVLQVLSCFPIITDIIHPPAHTLKPAGSVFTSSWFQLGGAAGVFVCLHVETKHSKTGVINKPCLPCQPKAEGHDFEMVRKKQLSLAVLGVLG